MVEKIGKNLIFNFPQYTKNELKEKNKNIY